MYKFILLIVLLFCVACSTPQDRLMIIENLIHNKENIIYRSSPEGHDNPEVFVIKENDYILIISVNAGAWITKIERIHNKE